MKKGIESLDIGMWWCKVDEGVSLCPNVCSYVSVSTVCGCVCELLATVCEHGCV